MNFGIPDNICNTGLGLGLGCWEKQEDRAHPDQEKKKINRRKPFLRDDDQFAPLLTLGLPKESFPFQFPITKIDPDLQPQASSPRAVSSFSNSSSAKKEKDLVDGGKGRGGEVELEEERVSSKASDEDEEGSPRKKLRLTKEQSAVLEDRFKEQSTLSPKQKHALGEQLNLRPRQVEVWFQNRRARTKLKQTELDCELLKRCCETLSEENKRLHKEIQELKSLKHAAPLYMRFPAATLTMCPSCERVEGGIGADGSSTSGPFTFGSKSHFYNSFTHPSAAW